MTVPPEALGDDSAVVTDPDPSRHHRVHLLGVAGTGMGALAGMLKAAGHEVTGSDQAVYPPMSEMLAAWGIPILTPYDPANLDATKPDLVVVGNVIRRVNPEATEMRRRGIPHASFPAALGSFFLRGRHPVVVVGTHGKTTTTALLAHVLDTAGLDPSFLVGGVARNRGANFHLGGGPHFVVEGDEYDTAYFDKGPKFLHYRPRTAILTSVEFDHADAYRDLEHYEAAFAQFVRLIPSGGCLAVSAAYPNALALARACPGRVVTYGGAIPGAAGWQHPRPEAVDYAMRDLTLGPAGARFELLEEGRSLGIGTLPIGGAHNVENALGVVAATRSLGLRFEQIREGLATFQGVRRRQEVRGEAGGVVVVDDFAHHPTAVRETIAATRGRFPGQRLWAVFEPRSNTSRRRLHQDDYGRALAGADRVSLKVPEAHDKVPEAERLDVSALVSVLEAAGVPATAAPDVETLVREVAFGAHSGDVLLVMSNGAFGGLIDRTLSALADRARVGGEHR